ncbi:retron system putative HNH endonuclease [Sulfurimonas sp.]|uniref:retron system putative HNH endonuclease n=1 Tax=Sulfurimonas sp. TaxID=2022749 RepID=UPI0019DF3E67|nr:retron system putative HNH endonuclease [Sulfurimonas sp.]MBE0515262.1 TIGR02646 family protein [Sulfurimonas sp.]
MKRVKKSAVPQKLKEYAEQNPHANWENDFKNSCQDRHKEVMAQLKADQGGLCCYCEMDFGSDEIRDDFRVEHFHPKSDSSEDKNWDLDWNNLFGCCLGGSDRYVLNETRFITDKRHRHSDVLKSDFVWDDEILNPLEIPAFPAIFEVMAKSGEMRVIEENCPPELKQKAINSLDEKKLNLNSPKLKEWRKSLIEKLREQVIQEYEASQDISLAIVTIVESQLSKDSYGNYPRFFSTVRSYFKSDAEEYLRRVGYDV